MAKVRYSFGYTVNMGNYEFARFDIDYEADVKADQNPSQALAVAQRFVEKKAEEKLDEIREARDADPS